MRDLTELVRFRDRLSFLYLEHGRLEQESTSVKYVSDGQEVALPAADLALLMLGPGMVVSHRAMANLADCNCLVAWCGEQGVRYYAHGRGGTHLATNLLKQAELWANQRSRSRVVRRMYQKRFAEPIGANLTIEQIRGREGHRVRTAYRQAAERFGVVWQGRTYDAHDWNSADPLNRALSAANACLHGLVHSAILTAGYSAAIGFIHTGKALSFVYDIADLYKMDLTVPIAFEAVGQGEDKLERRVRLACRDAFASQRLLDKILPDIREVLHGSDDSGKGASKPAGRSESLDDRAEGRDIPWPHDRPGT